MSINRTVRRNRERQGVPYQVNIAEIRRQEYDRGFHEGIAHSYRALITIIFYVLKTHLRISKENYQNLFKRCMDSVDCFRTGQLVPDDVDLMKEEILADKGVDMGRIDRK